MLSESNSLLLSHLIDQYTGNNLNDEEFLIQVLFKMFYIIS
jgi:hypothetical protein